jgi:hypothetical protein
LFDATPIARWYAIWRRIRLAGMDPVAEQAWQLQRLVRRAASTRFGRDHGFARIRNVADFQKRVPLRRYEDFWHEYWKPAFPRLRNCTWPGTIPFFALTSGTTTGETKYIPCSAAMVRANRRAGLGLLTFHLANRPASRALGGMTFLLGGSTDLTELTPGIHAGDLSGIEAAEIPPWARPYCFPSRKLALLADWEEKINRLAPLSLSRDIRIITGTPSWLLVFFDKLAALSPSSGGRLVDFYPNLELLVHGGVHFAPYRRRFLELLEGSHAETREAYAASEGFIAVADRGDGEGLRLVTDNGLFFEFVPVSELSDPEPRRFWLADVEPGVEYALAVSNCAGAFAYILGDTVRFVQTRPPRILVTGRTSYTLSSFGEHLIDAEIEEAVSRAAETVGAAIADFSVGPVFPERPGELGGHLYIVEFVGQSPDEAKLRLFAHKLDEALATTNADYRSHRAEGFGLRPPEIEAVPPGTFAAWMKERGQLGGQHKVPRIINDPDQFGNLRTFARTR